MEHYAGIDVSLERSSVCVVDSTGRIVREAKVASEPEALARFFDELGLPLARIGLKAGEGWVGARDARPRGLRERGPGRGPERGRLGLLHASRRWTRSGARGREERTAGRPREV